jgi:hypothetical protein
LNPSIGAWGRCSVGQIAFWLEHEAVIFDGAMPGQSGPDLTLELQASQKQSFIQTMEQFLSSLKKY